MFFPDFHYLPLQMLMLDVARTCQPGNVHDSDGQIPDRSQLTSVMPGMANVSNDRQGTEAIWSI